MADIIKSYPETNHVTAGSLLLTAIYFGDKEEAMIGFYVPQRNQYILHNNTTKISYVYDIPEDKWTTFEGLDIEKETILSGGSAIDHLNLILTEQNEILQYPSDEPCSASSYIKKKIRVNYADFISFDLTFTGSASADIKVFNPSFENASISTTKVVNNFEKNNLPLGYYGNKFEIKIKGAKKIDHMLLKYNPRKTRK